MDTEKAFRSFADEFCKQVWELDIEGVGVTGSYARGDYSKERPDVNFALFVDKITPELSLQIGEIASNLNNEYSKYFNLRPEFHPARFVFPWGRDEEKQDLFFKIAFFELEKKNAAIPFGRPGYVVEGHKKSIKMWHGKNYLQDTEIKASNAEVLKGATYVLPQWLQKAKFSPLSYNLNQDTELFFNEALVWGKLGIMQYAWIQGIKNGLDYSSDESRAGILEKVHNKKTLRTFLELPKEEMEMVNLILDGRLNYNNWKSDKKRAEEIYLASFHLLELFLKEAQRSQEN